MPVVCKHFLYTQNMAKEAKYCEIMQHKTVGETHGEAMDGDGVFVPLSHVAIWASIHARSGWFIVLERVPCYPCFWPLPQDLIAAKHGFCPPPNLPGEFLQQGVRRQIRRDRVFRPSSFWILNTSFVMLHYLSSLTIRHYFIMHIINVNFLSSDSPASNSYERSAPSQDGVPAQLQDGGSTAGMPGKLDTD